MQRRSLCLPDSLFGKSLGKSKFNRFSLLVLSSDIAWSLGIIMYDCDLGPIEDSWKRRRVLAVFNARNNENSPKTNSS